MARIGNEPESLAEAMDWFRKQFRADVDPELCVSYQMELRGAGGGVLSLEIEGGRLRAAAERVAEPDVVYRLAARDLFGILGGRCNPDLMFLEKRIDVDGDLSLALKLRSLFRADG